MKRREQTKQLKHATEMKRPGPPDIAAEIVARGGGGGGGGGGDFSLYARNFE
jgi:hypothetical protein